MRFIGTSVTRLIIIFANDNPNEEDPWDMPPGLCKRKTEWKGNQGFEKDLYHPEAKVMFQPNAWFDENAAKNYFE